MQKKGWKREQGATDDCTKGGLVKMLYSYFAVQYCKKTFANQRKRFLKRKNRDRMHTFEYRKEPFLKQRDIFKGGNAV